ncbi:MAG TPA: YceI family protein [Cyclobacteriaceae bacterium]|nr:YceI family protein [Cyclobacteriaceae bacterium]
MKKIFFFVLMSLGATAQQKLELNQLFPIEASHSYVEFTVTYMGYARFKGRFADFTGLIRYDEKNPANTSVSVSIKTESIDTDNDFRDKDLKSENWFDATKYPLITFVSKKAILVGGGFDLTGDLTIKGITNEVVLKVQPPSGVVKDVRSDLQVFFSGTTKIDRTAFGVEGKNWSGVKEGITAVSNEVAIEVGALGKQLQVSNLQNMVKFTKGAAKIYKAISEGGVNAGLAEFNAFVSSKSADVNMLSMTGRVLRAEGKINEAQSVYEANRDAFPDSWEVWYALGEIALLQNDLKSAKTNFEEALKKDPENIRVREVLRHL